MAADTRPIDPLGRPDIVYDRGHGLGTLTRRFKIKGKYTTAAQLPANIKRAFEAADFEHTDFLLAEQAIDGTEAQDGETSILRETYIQVPALATTEVQIGGNVVTYSENGLKVVEQRKFVKRTHTLVGTVGETTGEADSGEPGYDADISGLYLSQNLFVERGKVSAVVVKRWTEAGLLAIRPIKEGGFTLAQSYIYTSQGVPPSTLHATAALPKPGGGNLAANATFFEPEVQNVNGFPRYSQLVINAALTGGSVKIHSKEEFFTVTDPGEMDVGWTFTNGAKAGTAQNYPEAVSEPRTYRKKALVEVYLTTANTISEVEAAYNEKDVDWLSMSFINYYYNEKTGGASTSGRWRPFNKYLRKTGISNPVTTTSEQLGEYYAEALTYLKGGITGYPTTGIYRVQLSEYEKGPTGQQYFLKTVVTF